MQRQHRGSRLRALAFPVMGTGNAALALFVVTMFLAFFRAYPALVVPDLGHDSGCYLNTVYRLVGVSSPPCYSPSHFPGVALAWLPAALLARAIAFVFGGDVKAWIAALTGLSSFFFWAASLFLLARLRDALERQGLRFLPGNGWLVVFFLCVPALNYAVHETHLVHSAELLVALGCLYLIVTERFYWAAAAAAWLTAIRLNDALIVLILAGRLVDLRRRGRTDRDTKLATVLVGVTSVAVCALGIWIGFFAGYNRAYLSPVLARISLDGAVRALFTIHYGMTWFIPLWLVVLGLGIAHAKRLSWAGRGALAWMGAMLLFFIGHSMYLYEFENLHEQQLRYFTGTFAAAFFLLWELGPRLSVAGRRLAAATMSVGAVWYTFFVWVRMNPFELLMAAAGAGETGSQFVAHDGSRLPILFRKIIAEPLGASPVGFSLFSWLPDLPIFAPYRAFRVYAAQGPALAVLTAATVAAVALATYLIIRPRARSAAQTEE